MADRRPYVALMACTAEPVPRCDGCPYLRDVDCINHVMLDAAGLLETLLAGAGGSENAQTQREGEETQ